MASAPLLRSFAQPPWPWLFAVTAFGLVLSILGAGHAMLPDFCSAMDGLASALLWPGALEAAFAINPPLGLLAEWALMLVAMMPPLLAMPLMYIWRASRPRKRAWIAAAFLVGYFGVWMAVGAILTAFALLLRVAFGSAALVVVVLLALLWSASPYQRAALNRGHRLQRIGLFGWRAIRDGAVYGALHGLWCVASCWVWMLVPLVAGAWHVPLMLIAGGVMLMERLSSPQPVRWHRPLIWVLAQRSARLLAAARGAASHHG